MATEAPAIKSSFQAGNRKNWGGKERECTKEHTFPPNNFCPHLLGVNTNRKGGKDMRSMIWELCHLDKISFLLGKKKRYGEEILSLKLSVFAKGKRSGKEERKRCVKRS